MNYNKTIIAGRVARDPELRYTPSGTPICDLGLASNRRYRQGEEQKEEALFIDVVIWGRLAELMANTLSKGSGILVEGRLQQDRWEDQDGNKRSKHKITAESIQYTDKAQGSGQDSESW